MSCFKNVEVLRNFHPIYEEPEPMSHEDVLNAFKVLKNAYKDVEDYLTELMSDEQGLVELVLPFHDFKICNIVSSDMADEIFQFSFGTFSLSLWNKLVVDKNNPVFQLLEYFEFYVRLLQNLLAMQGFDIETLVTVEVLNEYQIMDIFSLHNYIGVYDDFQYFIPKKEG